MITDPGSLYQGFEGSGQSGSQLCPSQGLAKIVGQSLTWNLCTDQ